VSITAVKTVPSLCAGGVLPRCKGILAAHFAFEGAGQAHYTTDGWVPSATNGMPIQAPGAGAPTDLYVEGRAVLSAMKIIGDAAGDTVVVEFFERA
jgi:hypothetical protein